MTSLLGIQQPLEELKVVHHADVHGLHIHLAHRLDDSRRTLLIRPLGRADTVRERHPCQATVRHGVGQLTNRRVIGDRQGAVAHNRVEHLVLAALFLRPLGDIQRILVNIVVIITVFRCIQAVAAQRFMPFEVGQQSIANLLKRVLFVFKHQPADRGHRVDIGCQAREDQSGPIVEHRATSGDIFSALHATLHHQRHERFRGNIAVYPLADHSPDCRETHDVGNLRLHRSIELLKGTQITQVTGIQPLVAVKQHHAATVEHELDGDRPLGVSGGGPLIDTPRLLRLDATHQAVIASVFKIKALAQHHLDVGVIEVAGRETHPRFHDVDDFLHVFLRRLVMNTAAQ
ncbi:hypothetical protein D3C71_1165170 [compost metagenome]